MNERVSSGQPLKTSPLRKAHVVNEVLDAAQFVNRQILGKPTVSSPLDNPTDLVTIRNLTCADLQIGDVVQLGDRLLDADPHNRWPWFKGVKVAEPIDRKYAIVREPIPQCGYGKASVSGICLARVNFASTADAWCSPAAGSAQLQSATSDGLLEILSAPDSDGVQSVFVRFVFVGGMAASDSSTTTPPGQDGTDCSGAQSKWTWNSATGCWELNGSPCTTSSTTSSSSSSSSSSTTADACACNDGGGGSSSSSSSSSTTADCRPQYPSFLGTANGQCTFTPCSTYVAPIPVCATSTSSTTTSGGSTSSTSSTTTMSCGGLPSGCAEGGSTWVGFPGGGWILTKNCCPCGQIPIPPAGAPAPCATAAGSCLAIGGPPAPPGGGCGTATFTFCSALVGIVGNGWVLVANNCTCGVPLVPNQPGADGATITVDCGQPPGDPPPSTSGDPRCSNGGPCEGCPQCSTTSTSSTSSTSTNCDTGGCHFSSNGLGGWTKNDDTCPDSCPCSEPAFASQAACDHQWTPCRGNPNTTTTTSTTTSTSTSSTTTSGTSTSSTSSGSTTTTAPCSGECYWECDGREWVGPYADTCAGNCPDPTNTCGCTNTPPSFPCRGGYGIYTGTVPCSCLPPPRG